MSESFLTLRAKPTLFGRNESRTTISTWTRPIREDDFPRDESSPSLPSFHHFEVHVMTKFQASRTHLFEVVPQIGMGPFRLGESDTTVRQALDEMGLVVEEPSDPYCWELRACDSMLCFSNESPRQLVQILTQAAATQVAGRSLIGLRVDEALLELGVRRFDDTVWSMVSPETDFANGQPYTEKADRAKTSSTALLLSGTLWIRSLGLGLELLEGCVSSVCIREVKNLPRIGCGPITEQALADVNNLDTLASKFSTLPKVSVRRKIDWLRWSLVLATLVTVGVLAWVIFTMANDYMSWKNGTLVEGVVVTMSPEGPFPDELRVKYPMPNDQFGQATIPSQYTIARELGQAVELVYRDSDPSFAMTPLQSRDHFSSLSMTWLIILIPLFSLEICLLFPNFNRRRR